MRPYFSEENNKKTLTNTGFCIDCETIRTLQTLSDTKNNPERVGFEPTNSYLLNDFESFAFDHSATSPHVYKYALNNEKIMNYIIILIFNSTLHLSSI